MTRARMNERRKRVVCFGELLLRLSSPGRELLLQSPRLDAHFGGAEANVAVSLARFGHDAAMISIVPSNALGEAAVAELRRHGVDTHGVARRAGRMGLYFLTPGAVLRPSEVLYDRADSAFALAAPDTIDWRRVLEGADWLHVSGVTPAVGERAAAAAQRAAQVAAEMNVGLSFDGNYRERLWSQWDGDRATILRELLGKATIAFINEKDVALALGTRFDHPQIMERRRAAAHAAFAAFPQLQQIYSTLRDVQHMQHQDFAGAMFTRNRELHSRSYALHDVVDRIGSGDAFAAGVLHGIIAAYEDQQILEFATAAAALKHSVPGDFNLVRVEDVRQLLDAEGTDVRR